ncbi:MAG: RidA family protein [Candidatus Omnitrophota bacterium]
MEKKVVKACKAPQPIGPYHQAVSTGSLVYTSGQIAIDPKTGELCQGAVADQARLVLNNLKGILEDAGSSLEKVIKTTVFLKNMGDFAEMNKVYAEFFKAEQAPARSTVEVARLPKDVLVEIEAVAII